MIPPPFNRSWKKLNQSEKKKIRDLGYSPKKWTRIINGSSKLTIKELESLIEKLEHYDTV